MGYTERCIGNLLRPWPSPTSDDEQLVAAVVRSGSWYNGPETAELEREWGAYLGGRAVALGSCVLAIQAAVESLAAGPCAFIVPAFTFAGTVNPVIRAGARPVFADVDPETYNLTASAAASAAETYERLDPAGARSRPVRGVVAVHMHGVPCELEELTALCRDRGWRLVEDCCQAHGSLYGERPVGSFGAVGCSSLNVAKALPAGQGGLAVTSDPDIYDRLVAVSRYGIGPDGLYHTVGLGTGLTEFAATLARARLRRLDGYVARSREVYDQIESRLKGSPFRLQRAPIAAAVGWHKIRVSWGARLNVYRTTVVDRLESNGLPASIWEREPLPDQPAYFEYSAGPSEYRNARRLLLSSVILGNDRYPLPIQSPEIVDRYADGLLDIVR